MQIIGEQISTDGKCHGVSKLPKKNPGIHAVVYKSYFVLDTESGLNREFKRHAYIH